VLPISSQTRAGKLAGYLMAMFSENGPQYTCCMQAVGPLACMRALAALGRLQEMLLGLEEGDLAGSCVVFKPQFVRISQLNQQRDGDTADNREPITKAMKLFVSLAPKAEWPDAAFQLPPPPPSRSDSDDENAAAAKGSSSSRQERRIIPMAVRPQREDEQEKLYKHALVSSSKQMPAQFSVGGPPEVANPAAFMLLREISRVRREALTNSQPWDVICSVWSFSYTVDGLASSVGEEQGSVPAEPSASNDSSVADDTKQDEDIIFNVGPSSGPTDESATAKTRRRLYVTSLRCEPRDEDVAALQRFAKRREAGSSSSSGSRGGKSAGERSRTAYQTRPGYVEVREEEWIQLKEQLQVVPHLTEQLQIMTRQHEQLLSLLAAQQGQQQEQEGTQQQGQS